MNPFKTYTDEALILTYQSNQDAQAFGELYQRYHQKVFLYCAKVLSNRDLSLDLTQDIFIKVADKLSQLNEACTFVSWLFTIAHNDCMSLLKKQNRSYSKSQTLESTAEVAADFFDYEAAIKKEKRFEHVKGIMEHVIPMKDKVLLTEKYLLEKPIVELMKTYNLSASAIKMRLSRSRNKVRKLSVGF